MSDKLIIFDYSGTLSPEMAAFARPDNLLRQLQMSGLAALGVDNTDKFWELVNDTWQEGSTTGIGYKKAMLARLLILFPDAGESILIKAVSDFVDSYLAASLINERWRPVLENINGNKSVQVIIATDHYAEATNAIINYLAEWDIAAASVPEKGKRNYFVANSADLGFHKDNSGFWKAVHNTLQNTYDRILLIDDFGQNEQAADAYGRKEKISERRQKTLNMLNDIFLIPLEYYQFASFATPIAGLIAESSIKIKQFIS